MLKETFSNIRSYREFDHKFKLSVIKAVDDQKLRNDFTTICTQMKKTQISNFNELSIMKDSTPYKGVFWLVIDN